MTQNKEPYQQATIWQFGANMMYYICVEHDQIVSILNYEPAVPDTVTVYEIADSEYRLLQAQTHYFDLTTFKVCAKSDQDLALKQLQDANTKLQSYLTSTDWQVLRHLRQLHLGEPTTLSDQEFTALEQSRSQAAGQIKQR